MSFTEKIAAQYVRFDEMRDEIHAQIIDAGISDVIEAHGTHLQTAPFEPVLPMWLREYIDKHPGLDPLPGNMQYKLDKAWRPYKDRTQMSRYVVSRARGYSTQKADIDRDLDPLATVISTGYEVGVITETYKEGGVVPDSFSAQLSYVSEALVGGEKEAAWLGESLNLSQLALIESAISRLLQAKRSGELSLLNYDLTRIGSLD